MSRNRSAKTTKKKPAAARPAPATCPPPPEICSFACPFSDFPPAEAAGLCRTMSPVYCRKLRKLVNKNMPCQCRPGSRAKKA